MAMSNENLGALLRGDTRPYLTGGRYCTTQVYRLPTKARRVCASYNKGKKPEDFEGPYVFNVQEGKVASARLKILKKLPKDVHERVIDILKELEYSNIIEPSEEQFQTIIDEAMEEEEFVPSLPLRKPIKPKKKGKKIVIEEGEGLIGGCGCCGSALVGGGKYATCAKRLPTITTRCVRYKDAERSEAQQAASERLGKASKAFKAARKDNPDLTRAEFFASNYGQPKKPYVSRDQRRYRFNEGLDYLNS